MLMKIYGATALMGLILVMALACGQAEAPSAPEEVQTTETTVAALEEPRAGLGAVPGPDSVSNQPNAAESDAEPTAVPVVALASQGTADAAQLTPKPSPMPMEPALPVAVPTEVASQTELPTMAQATTPTAETQQEPAPKPEPTSPPLATVEQQEAALQAAAAALGCESVTIGKSRFPCQWNVHYDESGNIRSLSIASKGLTGTIPSEFADLPYLEELSLSGNPGITGEIPSGFANLHKLETLNLDSTGITGELPLFLNDLTSLTRVTVSDSQGICRHPALNPNLVSGAPACGPEISELEQAAILKSLYTKFGAEFPYQGPGTLQYQSGSPYSNGVTLDTRGHVIGLYIQVERSGTAEGAFPDQIADLPYLEEIHIASTPMAGPIDGAVLARLQNLQKISIVHSAFSGPVPTELANLPHLTLIDLRNNQLEGAIPAELGRLEHLDTLNLSKNNLTGPIPAALGSLEGLRGLHLSENQLSGTIPPELAETALTRLDLWSNQLHGTIPESFTKMDLQVINLSTNKLEGPIPEFLANMKYLKSIDIGNNQFTGAIPPQLGSISTLGGIGLQNNLLEGPLPAELANLKELSYISLNGNKLTGEIPAALLSLENLRSINYEDNNGLCVPQAIKELMGDTGPRLKGPTC